MNFRISSSVIPNRSVALAPSLERIVHITNGTETIINHDLATRLTPNLTQPFYDFFWALYTSIVTFTSLGYGDLYPTGWSRLAASIEVFVGVLMVALFLFVFTRKMVR